MDTLKGGGVLPPPLNETLPVQIAASLKFDFTDIWQLELSVQPLNEGLQA